MGVSVDRICAILVLASVLMTGCAKPAKYVAPAPQVAPTFKENANWKVAAPRDSEPRGPWWEIFNDNELNALERKVDVSNETLKAVDAQYVQARAAVRGTRASLYPQMSTAPTIARTQLSGNRATSSFHDSYNDFLVPGSVSYEADLWGRVHQSVTASQMTAQASGGDVASVRLSVEAELATDYFTLRTLDREKELLDSTADTYARALELAQNRYRGGIASQADVAQAETQLYTTKADAVDVQAARAVFEHAIAVLVGQSASMFSLPFAPLDAAVPAVPAAVPSDLLERRPDIASAERRVAAANAQIGVATAAYYPIVTLGALNGFESNSLGTWVAGMSNFWSLGPAALVNVFDAGKRRATADQARAAYDQMSASYQQSVLSAFREVEDQLATLKTLEEESIVRDRAVEAGERSLTLATNRYRGGIASYLEVISAQSALLTNQRVAVTLLMRRMNATVLLLKALGGDWNSAGRLRNSPQASGH
jgi:NodT family efflux transporter outer membrane factor (OMF) lipoprotein